MTELELFLSMPDVSEVTDTVDLKLGENTVTFTVKPITSEQFKEYQRRAQRKSGNTIMVDQGKISQCILENHIVDPDFSDAKFLAKAQCPTAYDFLVRKIPAGLLQDIVDKVLNISGFNQDINIDIDNAKN